MKSLVKLIISIGIKLALVALLYAIAIGFCSCSEGVVAETYSSSTANNQEINGSEGSLEVNPSETTVPSVSLPVNGSVPDSNIENKNMDDTKNDEVINPTDQTRQDTRNTESVSNNPDENNSEPARTQTQATATPTPVPTTTTVPAATSTPAPTSTPKPTATPIPTPTSTPVPTATPTPEPTEAPKPAVAAYVQATFIVYGGTDDENPTYVESTVVRTYKVQPKDGCSYHSHQVSDYVCIDNQIDWTDLDNAFLKEHPGCVVHGYDTVGEQVIGFVDD